MEELLITLAEEETLEQSKNEVRTIADAFAKSKAYYNALAANAVMDYLGKNCLLKSKPVNLHSSAKMLVDFEIADIQLPNLHIDVRAVFDENEIFIPKKHFTNKILPDIYLVMKLDEDLSCGNLLGYIKPSQINTQNQNDEYYFVNKSALTPASNLSNLILSAPAKNQYMLSENAEETLEKLIMQYMDHDIDDVKQEKLIDYLKNSIVAREKLIEFENFERLSYMALKEFKDLDIENNDFSKYIRTLVTTDEFAQFDGDFVDSLQSENDISGGLFIDEAEENGLTVQETAVDEQEEFDSAVFEDESVVEELAETSQDSQEADESQVEELEMFESVDSASSVDSTENAENLEALEVVEKETPEVLDEFDAFEIADEFDMQDEMFAEDFEESVETSELQQAGEASIIEENVQDEEGVPVVEEEHTDTPVLVTEELELNENADLEESAVDVEENVESVLIDETVVNEEIAEVDVESSKDLDELPVLNEESVALQAESVETEEEDIAPNLNEPLSGEDLELQLDGLDNIGEELNMELSENSVESVDFDAPVVAVVAEETQQQEEPAELDVSEALQLGEVELAGETVLGLSEGVLVDDEAAEKELEADASLLSSDFVESVSDEEVNNAIAQSAELELDNAVSPVEEIQTNDSDNLSLEDLLSMESDLSASEEGQNQMQFIDDDEEEEEESKSVPENIHEIDESDLDFLNDNVEDTSAVLPEAVDDIYGEEQPESDKETDFAFAIDQRPAPKNNVLLPVAAFVAILGLAGAGAWYFLFNGKSSSNDIGLVDNSPVTPVQDVTTDVKDVVPSAVDDSLTTDIQIPEDASSVTEQNKTPKQQDVLPAAKPPAEQDVKPIPEPLTIQKIKKDFSQPNTYLSISKIVWDVPEYLTYNDDFSEYLQTLGSTLKLNLSSDLLLINENTVLDRVKVKIQLKDSGKKYSAELVDGCGAKSVDDLVLQSVKSTLNLLKPPVNSLDTADEDLYITIYL